MHFCPNCGLMAPDHITQCAQCGTALPPPAAPAQPQPTPNSAAPNAAAPGPHYAPAAPESSGTLNTWGYLLTLVIYMIPVVGLITALVWAVSSTGNAARRDLSRAYLLRFVLRFILGLLGLIVLVAVVFCLLNARTTGFGTPYYVW